MDCTMAHFLVFVIFGVFRINIILSLFIWYITRRKFQKKRKTYFQSSMALSLIVNGHVVEYASCFTLSWRIVSSGITSSLCWDNNFPSFSTNLSQVRTEEFGSTCFNCFVIQGIKDACFIFEDIQTHIHTLISDTVTSSLTEGGYITKYIVNNTYVVLSLLWFIIIHLVIQAVPYSYGFLWHKFLIITLEHPFYFYC